MFLHELLVLVHAYYLYDPQKSTRRENLELQITHQTVLEILQKVSKNIPYNSLKLFQNLCNKKKTTCYDFCTEILSMNPLISPQLAG